MLDTNFLGCIQKKGLLVYTFIPKSPLQSLPQILPPSLFRPIESLQKNSAKISSKALTLTLTPDPSMKNILKRFHIGTSHDPNRSNEIPSSSSSPAPSPSCGSDHRSAAAVTSPTSPSPSPSVPTVAAVVERKDYFSSEEEYQIQLAMAISASNSEFRDDPVIDQIRAATLLSLGTHRSNSPGEEMGAAEALSRRYWVS